MLLDDDLGAVSKTEVSDRVNQPVDVDLLVGEPVQSHHCQYHAQ